MPSQKELRWSQLKVGILTLCALAALTALIFLLSGSTGGLFTRKLNLRAYFENANGLKVGAPVTLDGVGKIAGLSGRQLARQFKAATGLTPFEYQQRLRLELASTLMKDSRLTLDVIAERCGFEDARSLRRLWNEKFGQPPSQDRLRMTEQRSQ